jgi:hypothetical protein
MPTQHRISFSASLPDFTNFLNKSDWADVASLMQKTYKPSLALVILGRAYQLWDQGNLKFAIVEGVTAVEVAISERLREKGNPLEKSLQNFWGLPLHAQLSTMAVVLDLVMPDVELAIKAIDIRNNIVHEGYNPPEDAEKYLKALLTTAAAFRQQGLSSHPRWRRPLGAVFPLDPFCRNASSRRSPARSTPFGSTIIGCDRPIISMLRIKESISPAEFRALSLTITSLTFIRELSTHSRPTDPPSS